MPDEPLDLSDIAEPTASKRRVSPRNLSDPLDTIAHYESGDQNVPNYRFDRGHTAQGNYQITNTNWRNYGPKVGIDTTQYPSAMKAPKDVQRKVASTMFDEHGFGDWAPFNPQLRAGLKRGEGSGEIVPAVDLSDIAEPADKSPTMDLSDIAETAAPAPAKPSLTGVTGSAAGARRRVPTAPKVTSLAEAKQADEAHIQATDKLSHDIAWHFGDSVLNQFNDLPEDRQIKIARLASQYAAADEAKRHRGEPIVESYDWKKRNQQMVGVTGDSVTDRGEMMARQQGLTPDKLAAMRQQDTAATNPLLQSTGVMRWLKETGATGTAGLLNAVAGITRLSSHGVSPGAGGAREATDWLQEKFGQLRGVTQQAEQVAPMGTVGRKTSGISSGLIEYAPPMLLGHPEGALASIGTGAATFGGYSGLQKYGEGASAGEALKEGALAAPFGALMGVPAGVLGTTVDNPLQAALGATALKGAGYYGIGRAEGMTPGEAAENAAVLSAFTGPELAGEAFNAVVGRALRGPERGPSVDSAARQPMEPAVKSAIESAFEVANVSPELAEKALKTPVVDTRQQAIRESLNRGDATLTTEKIDARQQELKGATSTPLNSPRGTATTIERRATPRTDESSLGWAEKTAAQFGGSIEHQPNGTYRVEMGANVAEARTPAEATEWVRQFSDELAQDAPKPTEPPRSSAAQVAKDEAARAQSHQNYLDDLARGKAETLAEQEVKHANPTSKLPKELAGAKPRYSYSNKRFELAFDDDLDRAAYISAQTKPSKADASYVRWAAEQSGMSEADVRAHGRKVREFIKSVAKGEDEGTLNVPKQRVDTSTKLGLTDKYKKQRGAVGEPPDAMKPAPSGVKTGAVADRTERIESTAVKLPSTGEIVTGEKADTPHIDIQIGRKAQLLEEGRGFVTSSGRFVDRAEAYKIARAAGQIREKALGSNYWRLESEDFVPSKQSSSVEASRKAEPIIGIVGSDGTVSAKPDPDRSLTHASQFRDQWSRSDHWHYDPETETVYWTAGARNVSAETKEVVESYLDRQGHAVSANADYIDWSRRLRTIGAQNRSLDLTPDERALVEGIDQDIATEHPSASQPRTPETGQFSTADDHIAVSDELLSSGKRMQTDYARLADHPGREITRASGMAVRNYFRQLYTFVNTHSPEKLELVRQAEQAEAAGDSVKATVLAERALSDTHDFANELGVGVLASRLAAKGIGGGGQSRRLLKEVRERQARADRWKGQEGAVGEPPEPMKPAPEGVRTGAVADLESARREKERSLPKHLAATEREPGDDTTYTELPNKLTQARVEKRIADQGIAATEDWYNKQEAAHPEAGAELTDAFRQLSDHYLTKLAKATDKAEIASLTAKAKQLAGTEAPRSTGLGQAIQAYAMLDKYTGPEVLLEAQRLAERSGEQLPDEIVKDIAKTGQEFKEADTKLTEIRKELAKEEKGLGPGKGTGKGSGTGINRVATARRIEQLRDQQTKLIEARQQAKIRQERTLKTLEQKPTKLNYWIRANNILRGFMVSAIPTAVRNYETQGLRFGVERLTDLFAEGLRRATSSDPHISMANLHRDTLRLFQSESRSKAVRIAGEYPRELNRLFASYGEGQVETPAAQRTFAGRVEKAFGSVESFVQKINWLNQLQEFHIRGAEFLSHMDMLVEREHGMPLEQFLRENGADKLSKEMISDSIDHALEVTFADLPAKDTELGKHMNSLIKLGNLIPPTVSPIPFARWFYNSWKFNYQFSPLGLADIARTPRQLREARRALQRVEMRPPARTEMLQARRTVELEKARSNVARAEEKAKIERYRTVAKAAIGTTFLGVAYAARSSRIAGEKWYEMRVPGTDRTIDARPFAPFSTYLFVAEAARRSIHGERPFSKTEFFAALGSSTSATGGMEALYDKYRRGDFDSLVRAAKSSAADVGTAILTPVRQVRDLLGEFDASQATTYDTATQPGLGPLKTSIPYGERLGTPLPKAYKPLSAEPIHAVHPITKFLGPRIITPKNFVEKEADRLRFDYNEVRPSTGVAAIDGLEEQWMGEFVGRRAEKLANNPNYAHQPDSVKAELYLKPLFSAGRTYARQRLASEHPDLYLKLVERSKSARERAMEKDLGVKQQAEPY